MLWTPNPKTVDAIKLCDRCGGIDRKHYANDHRDMRRYLSFHRACCCDGCDNFTVTITISGVTACNTCHLSVFSSAKYPTVNVNGTYSGLTAFYNPGTQRWFAEATISSAYTWNYWLSSTTCAGSATSSATENAVVSVGGTCISGTILIDDASIRDNPSTNPLAPIADIFGWTGSASPDDSLSNQLSCGLQYASSNGTITVAVP